MVPSVERILTRLASVRKTVAGWFTKWCRHKFRCCCPKGGKDSDKVGVGKEGLPLGGLQSVDVVIFSVSNTMKGLVLRGNFTETSLTMEYMVGK